MLDELTENGKYPYLTKETVLELIDIWLTQKRHEPLKEDIFNSTDDFWKVKGKAELLQELLEDINK